MVSPAGDNFARWNFTKVNTDLRIGKETIINASSLSGANFRGWPVECQKRYMQELYVKTYTWQSEKPESAQNLTKSLAPTHAPFSGSDTGLAVATKQTMTYALTSSSKPPGLPGDTNTGYVGYLPGPDQGGPSFPDDISAHFNASVSGWGDLSKALGRDFDTLKRGLGNYLSPPKAGSPKLSKAVDPDKDLCEDMVLEPLRRAGLDVSEFLGYLSKGADFYDWKTSQITVRW